MSGRGKGGKTKGKAKSRSSRAGLQFPWAESTVSCARANYAERVGAGATRVLAAVLEYLAAEVLELAGKAARDNKKSRIIPSSPAARHPQRRGVEQTSVWSHIAQGGVLPNIQPFFCPRRPAGWWQIRHLLWLETLPKRPFLGPPKRY
ncbi:hypothetical protein DPMN_194677 [Dreissena polymorpha]|uniref:Histone H2A n=1 Tax=Dreissena polymorpha TaxID=45954 RepID=A0A9D3Y0N0_DREPO|nr:hypothetical protein DPMN_194677 [Dreissena polymorpha]